MRNTILILALLSAVTLAGQWTRERGDSIYAAYLREIPAEQQQEPYWITCVIRYDDIGYQQFNVLVRWHYLVAQTGKYRIIPVDGRPFSCDNVSLYGKDLP